MARVLYETVEVSLVDIPQVQELLEEARLEQQQLREERDFWRNEYDELLMATGGKDPRRE